MTSREYGYDTKALWNNGKAALHTFRSDGSLLGLCGKFIDQFAHGKVAWGTSPSFPFCRTCQRIEGHR